MQNPEQKQNVQFYSMIVQYFAQNVSCRGFILVLTENWRGICEKVDWADRHGCAKIGGKPCPPHALCLLPVADGGFEHVAQTCAQDQAARIVSYLLDDDNECSMALKVCAYVKLLRFDLADQTVRQMR